ncbi:MAG: alkaline phosphatase family protein [Planctomycetota bacterium]|jgi:predicted AlkP superfamily phosphohydrolase/phosphomutase
MPSAEVMVIGLDALTLDLALPWIEEGRLPNLARFVERGAWGPLRSTIPSGSPTAWSTFATGLNAGKHGVLGFYQLQADSYQPRLMNAASRRGATFWELAGRRDVRGGVLNLPFTFPPKPFNGFLISGMLSPRLGPRMATPPEAFDDLMAASPDYAIDVDLVKAVGREPEEFLQHVLANLQARLRAALGLYRRHRPPLFCVVFVAADRACHYLWPYMEAARAGRAQTPAQRRLGAAIRTVYEQLDHAVGALAEEAGEGTDFILLSDHGAGPLRKGLSLRNALARDGLLVRLAPGWTARLKRRAVWTFARRAPAALKRLAKALFPGTAQSAAGLIAAQGIDLGRSMAYPSGSSQGVFVNLKGRQPEGIVGPGAEYDAVRERIVEVLCELRDPETGRPVAARVHRREEVWSGPCLQKLPDVVLVPREKIYSVPTFAEEPGDDVFYSLPKPSWHSLHNLGGHRADGVLLAAGPHVRGLRLEGARIADVPATILALLGCPIPEDLDGRVLSEMLTDDVPSPQRTAPTQEEEPAARDQLSSGDREAVEERLRGLGYM